MSSSIRVVQVVVTLSVGLVLLASSSGEPDALAELRRGYHAAPNAFGRMLGGGTGPAVGATLLLGFVWAATGWALRAVTPPSDPADATNPYAPPPELPPPPRAPGGIVPPAGIDPIAHLTFSHVDEALPPPTTDAFDPEDPHQIVLSGEDS